MAALIAPSISLPLEGKVARQCRMRCKIRRKCLINRQFCSNITVPAVRRAFCSKTHMPHGSTMEDKAVETLRDILTDYNNKPEKWRYYSSSDIKLEGAFDSEVKALSFIKSYFQIGGKEKAFTNKIIEKHEKKLLERSIHIVSTFLLGLKIAECIGIDVTKADVNNLDFRYLWFITCLYHDVGYVYEGQSCCDNLRALSVDGLEAIQGICDIKYLHEREFRTYSKDKIDIYLKGRATCRDGKRGKIDHGIVGGLMLYDGLRKQFEDSWRNRPNKADSRERFCIKNNGREMKSSDKH